MNGRNEGCFLKTLNLGCMMIFAIIAFVIVVGFLGALL